MVKFGFCYVLGVVILLAIIQEGTSLKCYECLAPTGGVCGNLTKVDKKKIGTIKCGSKQKYCGVQQLRGNGSAQHQTQIKRSCFTNATCDSYNNLACNTCQKDKCNSSVKIMPSLIFGTFVLWVTKRFGNWLMEI